MSILFATKFGQSIGATAAANSIVGIKDKGSIGNRIEYATKQTLNTYKGLWKIKTDTFVGAAATAAATAGVAKSKTAQEVIKKGFKAVANSSFGKQVGELALSVAPYAKKAIGIVKALPGPAKAVLAAGAILTSIAVGIHNNQTSVKAGKIDQEYTDKAKLQETLK